MVTERDALTASLRHPFFWRMFTLRQLFASFEDVENHRGGAYQDADIEMRARGTTGHVGECDPESLLEYGIETGVLTAMHRLCQIVLLYSTFESLCSGTLRNDRSRAIDAELVKRAKKRHKEERKNFILTLLDEAERDGMQSSIWPSQRRHIEVFVALRGHLVHQGLEVTKSLRSRLEPLVGTVDELPEGTTQEKLDLLGQPPALIRVSRLFVSTLSDKVEKLATHVIVPVDREETHFDEATTQEMEFFRNLRGDGEK